MTLEPSATYLFGEFRLDPANHRLSWFRKTISHLDVHCVARGLSGRRQPQVVDEEIRIKLGIAASVSARIANGGERRFQEMIAAMNLSEADVRLNGSRRKAPPRSAALH